MPTETARTSLRPFEYGQSMNSSALFLPVDPLADPSEIEVIPGFAASRWTDSQVKSGSWILLYLFFASARSSRGDAVGLARLPEHPLHPALREASSSSVGVWISALPAAAPEGTEETAPPLALMILAEAHHSADPVRLIRLFAIADSTTMRYVQAAHPEKTGRLHP
ncbi:hypothetical protein NKH18_31375 [Streptomyces sp. M10(2022)]